MVRSNNLVILRGRLGADPEAKVLPSGDRVANFKLATNSVAPSKDGQRQERTDWHSVDAWGQPGDFASTYLKKGDLVQVVGSLRYTVRESGGKDTKFTHIRAHELVSLDRRRADGDRPANTDEAPPERPEADGVEVLDGDYPF